MKNISLPFHDVADIGDGEVLVLFKLPGQKAQELIMRGVDFDRMTKVAEPPAPPPTRDQRIAAARARFSDVVDITPERRTDEVRTPLDPDPVATKPTPPLVETMNLQPAPLAAVFKINNDAGPDGSDMKPEEVYRLVQVEAAPGVAKHLRQEAFRRLVGVPFIKLMQYRPLMSKDLALRIAYQRTAALGNGNMGIGSGYMPGDWGAFIEGLSVTQLENELDALPEWGRPKASASSRVEGDERVLNAFAEQTLYANDANLDALFARWETIKSHGVKGTAPLTGE